MLKVVGANNSTLAALEWIKIEVQSDCILNQFIVMDKTFNHDGSTSNTNRHVYIFPKVYAVAGDVIYLHTKVGDDSYPQGKRSSTSYPKSIAQKMHFYWNHQKCVWNNTGDTITIFKAEVSDAARIREKE